MKPGDLDLSHPDTFNAGFPHDYFRMLRREAPVLWHDAPEDPNQTAMTVRQGFYVLSRYADVVHVSRSPKLFSSHMGAAFMMDPDGENLAGMRMMLINMDPPEHVKYRRLVQRGFTPRMVANLEPVIRAHATRVVDAIAKRGECDFVEDLAAELPLILICELMGIPQEDRRMIFENSNHMIGADDPEMTAGVDPQDAATAMWMYSNKLAAEKKANPDDTLISKYVNGEVGGERISELELNNFFVLLAVAGNETTRNATSHAMRLFSENPEQYDLLRSDIDRYLPGAIEEVLRCAPSVLNFRRTVTQDTEIRGVQMKRGDKVTLWYPSANRDEEVFENPDVFDITREKNDHIAFGIGEHFCLGANLARMQLRCILREVLTRLPDMHVSQPPRLQRSGFIDGIKHLQVRYTPEA